MKVLRATLEFFKKNRSYRFRDRRGHYASGVMACRRDQYWELTGEPQTNPTDLTGQLKMSVGKWIEKGFIDDVLKQLHLEGVHFLSGQVPIGGSDPAFDGYLDAYVVERNDSEGPYVIEVKTKSGIGADMFLENPDPGDYLAQMGLYLRDLAKKSNVTRGCFYFILLSNAHFGEMVQVDCKYDPATGIITAHRAEFCDGSDKKLNFTLDVNAVIHRMKDVENAVSERLPPSPDYIYKQPLTPEFLKSLSDANIRAAVNGEKILGDWHVKYSRYFNKQMEVDKQSREYTEFERKLLVQEYMRRHPKSKIAQGE